METQYNPDEYNKNATRVYAGTYANIGANSLVMPAVDEIHSRVNSAQERLQNITSSMADRNDRLMGERPEVDQANTATPVRIGILGAIEDALDRLDDQISAVERESGRLSRLA